MKQIYFFTLAFWVTIISVYGQGNGFAGGDGSINNPYRIATAQHLDNIRNVLDPTEEIYFIQDADIDLAGFSNWQPIGGGGTSVVFNGFYNGQFYTISNLTISRSGTNDVGLFGHVASGDLAFGQFTRINNVILKNVNISGNTAVGAMVGRVTGSGRNTIENCFVVGGSVSGSSAVGGLVGSHNSFRASVEDPSVDSPVVRRSYASVSVGGSENIGGLVGSNVKGIIRNSHASGTITGGSSQVGGLTGNIDEKGLVENSYSSVIVNGIGSSIGGLIGLQGTGTVTSSYWDTEVSGQSSSDGGAGRTTSQMHAQATFSGWDFASAWNILEEEYYPFLRNYNLSQFNITDPGQQIAGQMFELQITGAVNVGGSSLNGAIWITVTTDILTEGTNGVIFDAPVSFVNGTGTISNLLLTRSGQQNITVGLATVLNDELITLDVRAGDAIRLKILEQPYLVAGNYDDQPVLLGNFVVASVDEFDNISGEGLNDVQNVTVEIFVDGSENQDAVLGNAQPLDIQNGLVTFQGLTIDKEGLGYVLRFISPSPVILNSTDSEPFDVINIVDRSGFVVNPPEDGDIRVILSPFQVSFSQANDVTGALIAGNTNVQVVSSLEGLIFNQDLSFTDGATSFNLVLEDVGHHDLTFSIDGITLPVIVSNINAVNDFSDFLLALDPPTRPYYAAIPFTLEISEALDFNDNYITNAWVRVTSSVDGEVFYKENITFSPPGETSMEIVLMTEATHTLSVEVEGVTQPRTIDVVIDENISGFNLVLKNPTENYNVGGSIDLEISNAFNSVTSFIDFTGNYLVTVESNEEGPVFEEIVSFLEGNAELSVQLFVAANHTLTVKVATITTERTVDVLVNPGDPFQLVIISGIVEDIQGNNDDQPVKVGDITLEVQDVFGNRTSINLPGPHDVEVAIHPDSEGSNNFASGSTTLLDISSGTATFNDLFIGEEGNYKLVFTTEIEFDPVTAETNFFEVTNIVNQAGFDVVDPGPQVAGVPFVLEIINAKDAQGNLITAEKSLVVQRISPFAMFYNQLTQFVDGSAQITITINQLGINSLLVIFDNVFTENIDINVVASDISGFTLVLPGNQVAGTPFNLQITNATDKAGSSLTGKQHLVTVTTDNLLEGTDGLLFSNYVDFNNGNATVQNLLLFKAEGQNLTVTIDWVSGSESVPVLVVPAIATRFVFAQQPTGFATGEFGGDPANVGTVTLQTLDEYGNLSMSGLGASFTVTASINTGPEGAVLSGTVEGTLENGVVVFDNLLVDKNGTFTLSFLFNGTADPLFAPNPLVSDEFDMVNIEDLSGFVLLDPGKQYENVPFSLFLVNASDSTGSLLTGSYVVSLESDQTAEGTGGLIYNEEFTFTNGELEIPSTLSTLAIHQLTITIADIGKQNVEVIGVEVAADLSEFGLALNPAAGPFYQSHPFELLVTGALDRDGVVLNGDYLVTVTSDIPGEEEIFTGTVDFSAGLGTISLALPTITTYVLTVAVEDIKGNNNIEVIIGENFSGFSAALAELTDKIAGENFNINITDATSLDGILLGDQNPEFYRVTITSNLVTGNVFDTDVEFINGVATISLNLELADAHILTIAISGITFTQDVNVNVLPAIVSQLELIVETPPLGGTGTGDDTPTSVGSTIIIRTQDAFGNLSTNGLEGTQTITASLFTDGSLGGNAILDGDTEKSILTGTAQFDDLTLDKDGTGFVIQFSYSGDPDLNLVSVATGSFDMTEVNLYQISLMDSGNQVLDTDTNPLVFATAVEGYASIDAETITILREGNGDITGIMVAINPEAAGYFVIDQTGVTELVGSSQTSTNFTLKPANGLPVGNYQATITVTASNDISEQFNVFFSVLAPYAIVLTDDNDQLLDSTNPLVFDSVDEVYTPVSRAVTITNTGANVIENLEVVVSAESDFIFGLLSATSIAPEGTATFTITPKAGLDPGEYLETVTVRNLGGNVEVQFNVQFVIVAYTYAISISPANPIDLPSQLVGYDPEDAFVVVTITSISNGPIRNILVSLNGGASSNFEIIGSPVNLEANGDTTSFVVRPIPGLAYQEAAYSDVIRINANNLPLNDNQNSRVVRFNVLLEKLWNGSISQSWNDSVNWTPMAVPAIDDFVRIPSGTANNPVIGTLVSVNQLIIGEGATLSVATDVGRITIKSGGNVVLNNQSQLLASGGIVIESGASLVLEPGARVTSTGSFINNNGVNGVLIKSDLLTSASLIHNASGIQATVQRFMSGQKFHVISPPVSGQSIQNFLTTNPEISRGVNTGIYAMQQYNENGGWSAYFTESTTGNMDPLQSYSVRLRPAEGAYVSFRGTLMTTNRSKNLTRTTFGWNGLGNPFAASLGATDAAVNGFLTANADQLDPGYSGLYVFDPEIAGYRVINNTPQVGFLDQDYISLAQGFIVKSKPGGATVTITPQMRAHENDAVFYKSLSASAWYNLRLNATAGSRTANTYIAFNSRMTKGIDVTYDAGLFGEDPQFSIYSRLPESDNPLNLMVQALPDYELDGLVIPIGVNNPQGGEVTLFLSSVSLPEMTKVFLEDRVNEVFTELVRDSYTVEMPAGADASGRFFLHMYEIKSFPVEYFVEGGNYGTLTARVEGETILTGSLIIEGRDIEFIATPNEGYRLKQWYVNGLPLEDHMDSQLLYSNLHGAVEVSVVFEDVTTGIEDFTSGQFAIYAHNSRVYIEGPVEENSVALIYDMLGRRMMNVALQSSETNSFSIQGLIKGIYVVHIVGGETDVKRKLLID